MANLTLIPCERQEEIVKIFNNKLYTTSRDIARLFQKEHKNVLRDISNLLETLNNLAAQISAARLELLSIEILEDSYTDDRGKTYPQYLLNDSATMLLVFGYTTENAVFLKLLYMNEFKRMKQHICTLQSPINASQAVVDAAFILKLADITGNQLAIAVDNVYRKQLGFSAIETSRVKLVAPEQEKLYSPTELGEKIGINAHTVNLLLQDKGLQTKDLDRWTLTEKGKEYGVYVDSPRKFANGSVRWINWKESVLDLIS